MQSETASSDEARYQVRKLEITDKNKGFMELLQQLTVCDPVSDEVFQKCFEEFKSYGDDHIICVIEDVSRSKIVATGSVFIEKKFVRSCGKAGHIEDVVVDSSARGMQLGKKVIGYLADHARSMGCYKDRMMEELHSQGKTIEDIVNCLNRVPLHPQIVSAIKSAHAQGCDLKVLSDANQFFIETILKNHGVYDCFSEIITNPTVVDKDGRLRIFPYHISEMPPHGCDLCPPNLCKGLVVKQMQDSTSEDVKNQVIIYIGDGGGDFCPTLKLGKEDHVMPRKDFPLHNRILKSSVPIKPEVHEWSDGDELNKILLRLIDPLEA